MSGQYCVDANIFLAAWYKSYPRHIFSSLWQQISECRNDIILIKPIRFLVNGIKLQGQIESFDQFVILLKNTVSQMIYKHAISTVVPSRQVKFDIEHPGDDD